MRRLKKVDSRGKVKGMKGRRKGDEIRVKVRNKERER